MKNLKEFVENNPRLVTRKESTRYPGLFVLKYNRKVFYDNLWSISPLLLEVRGLVVDADYNVVVRPFTKIMNYGENNAGADWRQEEYVLLTRKVNGFMAAVTRHNDRVIISTTGSLDSDFVGYAEKYLSGITADMLFPNMSYMFEIVHPEDPHIITEREGAHFLAIVHHETGVHYYSFDPTAEIHRAEIFFASLGIYIEDKTIDYCVTFSEALKMVKECNHEGYVMVNARLNETIKVKSPYYLFNKFLARVGTDKLISGFKQGTIKQRIDEEYYPTIAKLKEYGIEEFAAMPEQDRLATLKNWIENG